MYPALPLTRILQDSVNAWPLYAAAVVAFAVVVTVAICEYRDRRRGGVAVARQVPLFGREPHAADWTGLGDA